MRDLLETGRLIIETQKQKVEKLKPSEFSERYCDMTSRSAIGGLYKFSNSPYNREIIDRFDEYDPYKKISIIKVPQSGLSTVLENMLCWSIAQSPCNMMILSGDEALSEDMVEKRIDAAIDGAGLRYKIQANTKKQQNKRTGDTKNSKEFDGHWVVFGSANNKKNFRQRSIKRGVLDDIDAAKFEDAIEGSTMDLFLKRFTWYANRGMKACFISTPTIKGCSNIDMMFSRSDQREYEVPCPRCGEFIVLDFETKKDNERFGLMFKVDKFNKLVENSVEYRCPKCGEHFKENHKYDLLNNGIWVPTNLDKAEPYHAGYHIGGLMLPPGTLTWNDQARDFISCYPNGLGNNPNVPKLKVFVNQVLGKSFEHVGVEVKSSDLQKNTREYEIGTIPCNQSRLDGNGEIVLITFACDINGWIKGVGNADRDDIRIDYEILAHSENLSTYSIDHGSVGTFQRRLSEKGRQCYTIRHDEEFSAWTHIMEIITKAYPTDEGKEMYIQMVGIDEGFGKNYARQFVDSLPSSLAWTVKGDGEIRSMPSQKDAPYTKRSTSYARLQNVLVNKVKDDVYGYMQLPWNREKDQPQNFMNYPTPSGGKYTYKSYFNEYEGETRVVEVNKKNNEIAFMWKKKQTTSPNHFWDCRIYNIALAEIACREICKEYKLNYDWANFSLIMKSLLYSS